MSKEKTIEKDRQQENNNSGEAANKTNKGLPQFIKFAMVGLFNTFLTIAVYNLFYHVFNASYHFANVMAFIISVFSAYILQNFFVFKKEESEKRVWWKVLIKTYISYGFTGLILTEILLTFWIEIIRIERYIGFIVNLASDYGVIMSAHDMAVTIAPFLNVFITVPINFLLNKKWTYRSK